MPAPASSIAGAGFIGLEVAATARGFGSEVTVVEPLAVPLERAVGPLVGRVCELVHRDHGVDLRLATRLDSVETGARHDSGVTCRLSDGTSIEADALLVAVGALPATSWLEGSGLDFGQRGSCATRRSRPLPASSRRAISSGGHIR